MSDLLKRFEAREMPSKDVPICLNLNLIKERDAALQAVASAYSRVKNDERMAGSSPALAAARAAVDDVEARIRDASVVIRITGVDRTTYNQFFLACPPRKGRQEAYNSATFFMHVARETGVYVDRDGAIHEMTAEEWETIDTNITDGEYDRIAKAVLEVNREVGGNDIGFLGSASETTRDSFGISVSPEHKASPRAASGAGSRKKSTPK